MSCILPQALFWSNTSIFHIQKELVTEAWESLSLYNRGRLLRDYFHSFKQQLTSSNEGISLGSYFAYSSILNQYHFENHLLKIKPLHQRGCVNVDNAWIKSICPWNGFAEFIDQKFLLKRLFALEFSRNTQSWYCWHLIEKHLVNISTQIHLMKNEILVQKRLKLIYRLCSCVLPQLQRDRVTNMIFRLTPNSCFSDLWDSLNSLNWMKVLLH